MSEAAAKTLVLKDKDVQILFSVDGQSWSATCEYGRASYVAHNIQFEPLQHVTIKHIRNLLARRRSVRISPIEIVVAWDVEPYGKIVVRLVRENAMIAASRQQAVPVGKMCALLASHVAKLEHDVAKMSTHTIYIDLTRVPPICRFSDFGHEQLVLTHIIKNAAWIFADVPEVLLRIGECSDMQGLMKLESVRRTLGMSTQNHTFLDVLLDVGFRLQDQSLVWSESRSCNMQYTLKKAHLEYMCDGFSSYTLSTDQDAEPVLGETDKKLTLLEVWSNAPRLVIVYKYDI